MTSYQLRAVPVAAVQRMRSGAVDSWRQLDSSNQQTVFMPSSTVNCRAA